MQNVKIIERAKAAIGALTPLKSDCGEHCARACCKDRDGEMLGMELFPGEEMIYKGAPWYKVFKSRGRYILVCREVCPRDERPLGCMVFPLSPVIRDGSATAEMDARAGGLCPLYAHGVSGLDRRFVSAVKEASGILSESPDITAFLQDLTEEIDEVLDGLM